MDPFGNGPDRRCVALRHGKPRFGRWVRGGGGPNMIIKSCCFLGGARTFKIKFLPKVYGFLEETLEGMV